MRRVQRRAVDDSGIIQWQDSVCGHLLVSNSPVSVNESLSFSFFMCRGERHTVPCSSHRLVFVCKLYSFLFIYLYFIYFYSLQCVENICRESIGNACSYQYTKRSHPELLPHKLYCIHIDIIKLAFTVQHLVPCGDGIKKKPE